MRSLLVLWRCKDRTHDHVTEEEARMCILLADAAHDLYAACEELVRLDGQARAITTSQWDAAVAMARAALAKAHGKS